MPPAGEHLWAWFRELHSGRAEGFAGPANITFQDIVAWAALMGHRPRPWEVAALKAMDNAFQQAAAKLHS